MNIKRILALMLCAAMVLTSGTFSSTVYAAELGGEELLATEEEVVDEETQTGSEELTAEEELQDEELQDEELQDDESQDEESEEDEELLAEEELEEDMDEALEEELDEEISVEGLSEEDAIALQKTADVLKVVSGELQWKEPSRPETERYKALGQTLSVLPGTTTIPSELFKNDPYLIKINVSSVEDTLATIEASAFEKCNQLEAFNAPARLSFIGESAFAGCGSLTTVTLSNVATVSKKAFENTGITQLTAPNCTAVNEEAFSGCNKLVSVSLPSVATIEKEAFAGCTKLTYVSLPNSDGVLTEVGDFAFKNTGLTSVDWSKYSFADGDLGDGIFSNCTALTYINLPAVVTIPVRLCSGCENLTTIIINNTTDPAMMTRVVDSGAFCDCIKLEKINLAQVNRVKTTAFSGDIKLTEVKFEYAGDPTQFVIDMDAFPNIARPTNLKMYGYIDRVQNYADIKGYQFVSLYESHRVTYHVTGGGVLVQLSSPTAKFGDIVTVTTTSSVAIDEFQVVGVSTNTIYEPTLTSSEATRAVFEFAMPGNEDVDIRITSRAVAQIIGNAKVGNFTASPVTVGGYVPSGGNGSYNVDKSGREFRLQYMAGYPGVGDKNWQWLFTSNNNSVVRVDNLGYVTAVGQGSATITAKIKNSTTSVEILVVVGSAVKIKAVEMRASTIPSRAVLDYEGTTKVIQINKAYVANNPMSFDMDILVTNDDLDFVIATPSYWSTVDSRIATVASSTSYNNKMKITIPKGAVGETMVMAYALNPGEKKVNENSTLAAPTNNLAKLIIRVVDASPRLKTNTFTVDYNSSIGTKLDLVQIYGALGEVDTETGLDIVQKQTVNGVIKPVTLPNFGIQIVYDEYGTLYGEADTFYAQKKAGFTLANNGIASYSAMYLHGYFENGDENGDKAEFYVPLGAISITNRPLNPSVALSGRINLFYGTNTEEGLKNREYVTAVQSLKNIDIEAVDLVDSLHYQNPESPEEDIFAENFYAECDLNDNSKIYIRMDESLDQLKKDKNGKEVVSGYLLIYYKGYDKPVAKPLTVTTVSVGPTYYLSKTTGIWHSYAKNQKVDLYLYKTTDAKRTPISLEDMDITFNDSLTTGNVFQNTITTSKIKATDDYVNQMTIKQDNNYAPVAGRAVIRIHHDSWATGKYLDYTYNYNVTKVTPQVAWNGLNSAVINKAIRRLPTTIKCYSNQDNVPISKHTDPATGLPDTDAMYDSVEYIGLKTPTMMADAQTIIDNLLFRSVTDETTGKQMLAITPIYDPSTPVANGIYQFRFTPKVDYNADSTGSYDSQDVNSVQFNVQVVNNPITVAMGSQFIFNRDCVGLETAKIGFNIGNIPSGFKQRDFWIDFTNATITNNNALLASTATFDSISDKSYLSTSVDEDETKNLCYASLKLKSGINKNNPFNYVFKVSGAELKQTGINTVEATVKDFYITVVMRESVCNLNVVPSGTLNMTNSFKPSMITYTATPIGFNTDITNVELIEIGEDGHDKASPEFFNLTYDYYDPKDPSKGIRNDKKVYLSLKTQTNPANRVVPNKIYKIKLVYTLSARTDLKPVYTANVIVQQTMPAVTVKQDVNKIFAGQDVSTRKIEVTIKPNGDASLGKIVDVDFKDKQYDKYYQAFTIARYPTGKATKEYQEINGYDKPMFIDCTNVAVPRKMYVVDPTTTGGAAWDPESEPVYTLKDNDILMYVDTTYDQYAKYKASTGQFYAFKKDGTQILEKETYPTFVDVRPDLYYKFTMTLTSSPALVLDSLHTVTLAAEFDQQAKNAQGTLFNVSVNVMK